MPGRSPPQKGIFSDFKAKPNRFSVSPHYLHNLHMSKFNAKITVSHNEFTLTLWSIFKPCFFKFLYVSNMIS
jgi:hypothetical protein